jgi:hypothetical protein
LTKVDNLQKISSQTTQVPHSFEGELSALEDKKSHHSSPKNRINEKFQFLYTNSSPEERITRLKIFSFLGKPQSETKKEVPEFFVLFNFVLDSKMQTSPQIIHLERGICFFLVFGSTQIIFGIF